MSDFTNLTTNDIWFHAFFAALSGSARTETLPPEDIARFAANIADLAVKVVLERFKEEEEDEPPDLRQMENKVRAIHGHPPLPTGPPRRTPAEVAEKACDMGMFPRAILAHIADLIARDRKGTA